MFQYAAGFALARQNGSALTLDTSAFERGARRRETLRELGLRDFRISASVLSLSEANRRRNPYGIVSKTFRLAAKKILRQYYVDWHPEVMRRRGDAYLEGYFQSARYFSSVDRELRDEFVLAEPLAAEIAQVQKKILTMSGSTVSLHARRGDYVANARNFAALNLCTPEYYSRAVEHLRSMATDLRLVVFSDDIDWVLANIVEAKDAFVVSTRSDAGKSLRPSQEMMLMASCRHHIISNSTFSWWGAYLNSAPGKIVIAPDRWTNGSEFDHANILPSGWLTLPV